jgi:hypothetical protein
MGRLAQNIKFWEKIGANNFALGTLRKGYVIPFLENPAKMFKKNNRSAMKNAEFVDQNNVIVVKILLYQNLNHFPNHTQIYNVNTYH